MTSRIVMAERTIAAPATDIFDVLARPSLHPLIDGSDTVQGVLRGPERLSLGARFGMRMHLVIPYVMWNRVIAFDEPREIAWTHPGRHVWRYRLIPVDERTTRVIESFEWDDAPLRLLYELARLPEKHALDMALSLERLERVVAARRASLGADADASTSTP
jgi:uncharacterized protein YndB with AHSA1/START domain